MWRYLSFVVLLSCRLILAEPAEFQEVAGRYPLYGLDGNSDVTGVVEVRFSEKTGFGFQLSDLYSPTELPSETSVFSPEKGTSFRKEGNQVIQEYKSDELSVRIEFVRNGKQIGLHASRCPKGGNCLLTVINESDPQGPEGSAAEFFKSIQGKYRIESAGNEVPHEGNNSADVSMSSEEANFTLPYCAAGGGACDPGYIDLTLSDTKVYRKAYNRSHVLYTVISDSKIYTWEERDGKIFFRNYQYEKVTGEVVVLTHLIVRKG